MAELLSIGLFLPLIGFMILLLFSGKIKRIQAGVIACSAVLISFACFSSILFMNPDLRGFDNVFIYTWIPVDGINAQ